MNKGPFVLFLPVVLLAPLWGLAQKTDTVFFYNGDRAICEIKSLEQGKLNIKTVAMGTISVEWRKVSKVSSRQTFEIVVSDHTTFFGRITGVDSARNATIVFGIFSQSIPLKEIVSLQQIQKRFWQKLDGMVNFGFSFIQGTENLQLNSDGNISYRTNRTIHSLSFNGNISANPNGLSQKQDGGYRFQYIYHNRVFNAVSFRWERNTELGIENRLITTLSGGYSPVQNRVNILSFEAGGSANREFSVADTVRNNVEAMFRASYSLFIFAQPKIFIDVESVTFPSLTTKGRIRSNVDVKVKWEIFRDFTFGVSFWGNYDNKPVDNLTLNFDWGTTTTVGYKF